MSSEWKVTIEDRDNWCADDETHVVTFERGNHASVLRVGDDALQQLVDAAAARGIVAQ